MLYLSIILAITDAAVCLYISPSSTIKRHWYLLAASYLCLAASSLGTLFEHLYHDLPLSLTAELARLAASLAALIALIPFRKTLMLRSGIATAYAHLVDSMRDTYYRSNAAGEVEMISASSVNIIGLKPTEINGRKFSEFFEKTEERFTFMQSMIDNNDVVEGYLT